MIFDIIVEFSEYDKNLNFSRLILILKYTVHYDAAYVEDYLQN